jgi:hypothetical protein
MMSSVTRKNKIKRINVKRIAISSIIFTIALCANAQQSISDEAQSLFAKGEYLKGQNILLKAINSSDPVEKARAQQTYAQFYENIVGNIDYALNFYNDLLQTKLPLDHPLRSAAQTAISRIKAWKVQYSEEDML